MLKSCTMFQVAAASTMLLHGIARADSAISNAGTTTYQGQTFWFVDSTLSIAPGTAIGQPAAAIFKLKAGADPKNPKQSDLTSIATITTVSQLPSPPNPPQTYVAHIVGQIPGQALPAGTLLVVWNYKVQVAGPGPGDPPGTPYHVETRTLYSTVQ